MNAAFTYSIDTLLPAGLEHAIEIFCLCCLLVRNFYLQLERFCACTKFLAEMDDETLFNWGYWGRMPSKDFPRVRLRIGGYANWWLCGLVVGWKVMRLGGRLCDLVTMRFGDYAIRLEGYAIGWEVMRFGGYAIGRLSGRSCELIYSYAIW